MKKVLLIALALISLNALAQKKEKIKGNREVLIKKFTVEAFDKLEVGEKFEVLLQKNDEEPSQIIIETDDNLFDVIHFEVNDGTLRFSTSKEIVKKKRLRISVFVSEKFNTIQLIEKGKVFNDEALDLDQLKIISEQRGQSDLNLNIKNNLIVEASGKSKLKMKIKSGSVKLQLHDNASLEASVKTSDLGVSMDGHTDCQFEGVAKQMLVDIKDRAKLNAKKIDAQDMVITAADKAESKLNASGNLVLKLSGDSETYIYNSPKINLKHFKDNAKIYKK